MDQLVIFSDMVGTLKLINHDSKKIDFNNISVEYQEYYLHKMLGNELYYEFEAGLSVPSPAQKWIDLRDGATFETSDGKNLKWLGLKNLLKFFIFYEYTKDNISTPTISGEVKKQNLHSMYANANAKMQKAYNKGVDLYGLDFNGIAINNANAAQPILNNRINCLYLNRSNTKATDSIMNQSTKRASAYNFISSKNKEVADTYPNWEFTKLSFLTW